MLLLVRKGSEERVRRRFARWELHAEVIGHGTADAVVRVRDLSEVVAELPIGLLIDEVPAYELAPAAPRQVHEQTTTRKSLRKLLKDPDSSSRRFAFRQYDSTVQANTIFGPGQAAAAVVRVEGTTKGLAMTTDCNPRLMRESPRRGAEQAVAEAALNLACVGAEPIAVTDCLNFGNPEKALVAWQLTEAVAGVASACRAFDVPIVSGNVSLYNESGGQAIPPTPTVGMVGLLEDVALTVGIGFVPDTSIIVLTIQDELAEQARLCQLVRELIAAKLLVTAQDVSEGGIQLALAECCFVNDVGATLSEPLPEGQVIVSCRADKVLQVLESAAHKDIAARVIGETGGQELLGEPLAELKAIWEAELQ